MHSLERLKNPWCAGAFPYVVVGGLRFYDRREIKDLLGYLRLLINPSRHRQPAAGDQRTQARDR